MVAGLYFSSFMYHNLNYWKTKTIRNHFPSKPQDKCFVFLFRFSEEVYGFFVPPVCFFFYRSLT